MVLFLESTCVRGDTHPFAIQVDPGIGESPIMIERLTFIEPFGVVDSSDDSGVPIQKDALVSVCHEAGRVRKIFIVGEELGLRHKRPIIVRTDERISH
jgi:hypothetical protein